MLNLVLRDGSMVCNQGVEMQERIDPVQGSGILPHLLGPFHTMLSTTVLYLASSMAVRNLLGGGGGHKGKGTTTSLPTPLLHSI